ncbi:LysR substrate-binding domain-containing protein [Methylobacterium sp. J-026]|uniref:LysR substrate-binding domain-containing protein n=1 Tax=Methylobacterium sp. J-026 TaxID=2836624 RepID=UPI001FBB7C31|nr:LysR substrate-binding domain-containing protein [Methylobacterium sp. J-026]MCJ2135912.1 LysR substrate-binding domain-containing protein [Methylobacterium sp. J-026]
MSKANSAAFAGIPLAKLRVFDAAARHANLVRAAAELGMTQGAVSHHVKALEDALGTALFHRGPRGVTLTEAGDLLADYVRRAFDELAAGLERIGQPRRRTTLVVAAPRSFALRVLVGRLGGFLRAHPWIDFRLDTHRYYADLNHSPGDIAIRAGDGSWKDLAVERLTHETLFPVCTPALCDGAPPSAAFLRANLLLHYAERPTWPAWLHAAGYDASLGTVGPSFSETALVLAAAEQGQGIAIGRRSLVADALAAGTLVRPFEVEHDDGVGYFLVARKTDLNRTMARVFSDWLLGEMITFGGARAPPQST